MKRFTFKRPLLGVAVALPISIALLAGSATAAGVIWPTSGAKPVRPGQTITYKFTAPENAGKVHLVGYYAYTGYRSSKVFVNHNYVPMSTSRNGNKWSASFQVSPQTCAWFIDSEGARWSGKRDNITIQELRFYKGSKPFGPRFNAHDLSVTTGKTCKGTAIGENGK